MSAQQKQTPNFVRQNPPIMYGQQRPPMMNVKREIKTEPNIPILGANQMQSTFNVSALQNRSQNAFASNNARNRSLVSFYVNSIIIFTNIDIDIITDAFSDVPMMSAQTQTETIVRAMRSPNSNCYANGMCVHNYIFLQSVAHKNNIHF